MNSFSTKFRLGDYLFTKRTQYKFHIIINWRLNNRGHFVTVYLHCILQFYCLKSVLIISILAQSRCVFLIISNFNIFPKFCIFIVFSNLYIDLLRDVLSPVSSSDASWASETCSWQPWRVRATEQVNLNLPHHAVDVIQAFLWECSFILEQTRSTTISDAGIVLQKYFHFVHLERDFNHLRALSKLF